MKGERLRKVRGGMVLLMSMGAFSCIATALRLL